MFEMGHNIIRAKLKNKSLVLEFLIRFGPLSRQQISNMLKLTPATITNLTSELIEDGLIWEIGEVNHEIPRVGRKSVLLDVKRDAVKVLGVHLRLDSVEMGIVNLQGQTADIEQFDLPISFTENNCMKILSEKIRFYGKKHDLDFADGIGVGSSGLVNVERGTVTARARGWENTPLASYLQRELEVPVYLDNNVRAMAIAEHLYGEYRDISNFLFIYVGRGVGAALVLNGNVYENGPTGGGEFGHITYLNNGKVCWCGNRGCVERYASEGAIMEDLGHISKDEMIVRLEEHDSEVWKAVRNAGEVIGTALASFVNMVHVEHVVLGGALASDDYPLADRVRQVVDDRSFLARLDPVDVTVSRFGDGVGVVGAGSLALLHSVIRQNRVCE